MSRAAVRSLERDRAKVFSTSAIVSRREAAPASRVAHLYPDLLGIYADRGNIAVLERRCAWRAIGFDSPAVGIGDPLPRTSTSLPGRRPGSRAGADRDDLAAQAPCAREALGAGAAAASLSAAATSCSVASIASDRGRSCPAPVSSRCPLVAGERRMIGDILLDCELDPGERRTLRASRTTQGAHFWRRAPSRSAGSSRDSGTTASDGFEGCRVGRAVGTYLRPLLPCNPGCRSCREHPWLADLGCSPRRRSSTAWAKRPAAERPRRRTRKRPGPRFERAPRRPRSSRTCAHSPRSRANAPASRPSAASTRSRLRRPLRGLRLVRAPTARRGRPPGRPAAICAGSVGWAGAPRSPRAPDARTGDGPAPQHRSETIRSSERSPRYPAKMMWTTCRGVETSGRADRLGTPRSGPRAGDPRSIPSSSVSSRLQRADERLAARARRHPGAASTAVPPSRGGTEASCRRDGVAPTHGCAGSIMGGTTRSRGRRVRFRGSSSTSTIGRREPASTTSCATDPRLDDERLVEVGVRAA